MGCCARENYDVNSRTKTISHRGCTDIIWLGIFILFLVLMIFIATFAFVYGNPVQLANGSDSFGNVCGMYNYDIGNENGTGLDLTDAPYLFYFDIRDFQHSLKICVSECPTRKMDTSKEFLEYYRDTGKLLCVYGSTYQGLREMKDSVPSLPDNAEFTKIVHTPLGPCPSLPLYESTVVLNRCVPKMTSDVGSDVIYNIYAYLNNIDIVQQVLSDLYDTRWQIVGLVFLAVVIAFILVLLLHFLAAFVSWIFMVVVALASIGGTVILWLAYVDVKYELDATPFEKLLETSVKNERALLTCSVIATIVTAIILLLIFVMRKRVKVVVDLFKNASKCLTAIPCLLFQPIVTYLALLLYFVFWLFVMACLATATHPEAKVTSKPLDEMPLVRDQISPQTGANDFYFANGTGRNVTVTDLRGLTLIEYVDPTWVRYFWWVYVVGLIWISEFILACQQMIIAGAVARWYFLRNEQGSFPLVNSVGDLILCHLGTVAKGALMISIFKLPRLILSYFDKYVLKKYPESKCVDCLKKCCCCCLYCMENFIRYINHNAYTIVAIDGKDFCSAAKTAFEAIVTNAIQVATINSVGDFILFLGKCAVMAITGTVALLVMKGDSNLNYYAVPFFIVCIFAYFIAHCVFSVYEMVIDTLFLCMLEDSNTLKENDAVDGATYYAPEEIKDFMKKVVSGHYPKEETAGEEVEMEPMHSVTSTN